MADFPKIGFELFSKENLEYFLAPKETGYDMTKTATYALLLIAAAYVIYKALKKLKVAIDERLVIAIAPYVVFGSCLRVLKDAGVVGSYIFQTPSIYVLIFSFFFSVFLLSIALQKKFKIGYHKTAFIIGVLILPFTFSQLSFTTIYAVFIVGFFLLPWVLLFKTIRWHTSNKIVSVVHMFDATTTFVSMSFFGYIEQHIVPTFIINIFGPISFIVLKLGIVGLLYIIDRISASEEDKEFGMYLKLIIGILGAATGGRDLITLAAGI